MLQFSRSFLSAIDCSEVRLEKLAFLYFLRSSSCSFLRAFSKRVSRFSISLEAGGGFQCLFFYIYLWDIGIFCIFAVVY
jgi:hypothetical protein